MSHVSPPSPLSPWDLAPVVPVVIVDDVEMAVPLARALVAGGLPAVEVTLRTEAALGASERIAAEVEGA
ncbi:MAG: keto-deoxy-phosphogluconate aldolase, partial [Streptomycetaceae bacterium]|nr:keto-deoxy-phosphogluconate aldolase [Streptomycetaceae bacterium]